MSLRVIPTLDGSGTPLEIVVVTRAEVSFENPEVTLNAVNDDGEKIQAAITFANGSQSLLTLFSGVYYEPIANFTDEEIDAKIVELVSLLT